LSLPGLIEKNYQGVSYTTMNANRRLQERKQPERIVLCKLGSEESGPVRNLSEGGLCFESLTPIEQTGVLQLRLSVDLDSPIEATGQLAWIDSEKRTGGLRFLELTAPAREQIRAWLSETSTAMEESVARFCRSVIKRAHYNVATEKSVIWQEPRVSKAMQLVPMKRYRAQKRRQFLLGVLIGFGIGPPLMIPMFRYAGSTWSDGPAETTVRANRAAQSSAQQTQASVVQPVSPNASTSEPAAVQTVSVAAPRRSPQRKSPQTPGASSTDLVTGTSSPAATPQSAKPGERVARSRPSTKAEPLGATQAAVAPAPAASNAHSSSEQVQHAKKVPPTPQQLWSALQAGNMKAAVRLADLYTRGEDVPVNCQQARVLLLVASAKNNAEASKKLQELDKGGCPQTTTASEPKP
jgi:PilZ domain